MAERKWEERIKALEEEIERIKARNRRVEADKAWELSWTRKVWIAILTYAVIVVFLFSTNAKAPFLEAIIPALAYILSTFTLTPMKKLWIKYVYRR